MSKIVKINKKGNKSLYGSFLWMTLVPLVLSGIAMMFFCSRFIRNNMYEESKVDLNNVALTYLAALDSMYDGDFKMSIDDNVASMYKGDSMLSGDFSYIDDIKSRTGIEISLFIEDTRFLTTIFDKNNVRMVGVGANEATVEQVVKNGKDAFYTNVRIGGKDYCAYYFPLTNSDGSIVGMVETAKETGMINDNINSFLKRNLIVMLLGILVTAFFIVRFASSIMLVIKKMMEYMKELAQDKLNISMDPLVMYREDELGEMGRLLVKLQLALKKLIERDVLTGLYNRRSAEKRVDDIEDQGIKYSVAIGDIDFFKKFNDTFGHECGDVVLKYVARLLNESMSGKGFAARWGGEEFLLVFENIGIDDAYAILMGIRENLHNSAAEYQGDEHKVTMTFGVEEKREDLTIGKLICAADDKLYEGKKSGRDRVIK